MLTVRWLRQTSTLAELGASSTEAQDVIATRYSEFAKYRDDTIDVLRAADDRIQLVAAVSLDRHCLLIVTVQCLLFPALWPLQLPHFRRQWLTVYSS